MKYCILWEIETDTDDDGQEFKTPLDVAKWTKKVQTDPDSRANVFTIMNRATGEKFKVDLDKEIVQPHG